MLNLKTSLSIGALVLSLIGGCTASLDSGKITEKKHEPQRHYLASERNGPHPQFYTVQYFDDEDFIITFTRTFKGVPHSRTVYVSKEVYDSLKEGDVFDTSKFSFEDEDKDVKLYTIK